MNELLFILLITAIRFIVIFQIKSEQKLEGINRKCLQDFSIITYLESCSGILQVVKLAKFKAQEKKGEVLVVGFREFLDLSNTTSKHFQFV